jgi:hypothetical protein
MMFVFFFRQKKLHKITKELLNREEIQCLLTDSAETFVIIRIFEFFIIELLPAVFQR